MNKTFKLTSARILLAIILMSILLPFLGSMKVAALNMTDLDINYSSNGIDYGNQSAWGKNENQDKAWQKVFTKYKGVIMGVSGVATLTMVVLFIINFMKLGQASGNPQARSQALTGLLWTGIAAAGAGGVTIFVGVFSSMLK